MSSETTDTRVAVEQVQALEQSGGKPKVVVADSLYGNQVFLGQFQGAQTVCGLVRLRRNLTLYEPPPPRLPGRRGAPRKHGACFKLADPYRPPERSETFELGGQTVRLCAWSGLHLRPLPDLGGVIVRVEFLKADGTPRYKRPLWLFWTGPQTVALQDVCRMYLWRFAIEHAFRFMKQHLGLNACQSPNPHCVEIWRWLCGLAYWQLLLMRPCVAEWRPAWHPRSPARLAKGLTPGQVQRGAGGFWGQLGTPAASPRPAGKGWGRLAGYQPAPRPRYKVVRKGQKRPQTG